MSQQKEPVGHASPNKTEATEPQGLAGVPEAALSSGLDLAVKIVLAYHSIQGLEPGGEVDLPPIRQHHDTITITVARDKI